MWYTLWYNLVLFIGTCTVYTLSIPTGSTKFKRTHIDRMMNVMVIFVSDYNIITTCMKFHVFIHIIIIYVVDSGIPRISPLDLLVGISHL